MKGSFALAALVVAVVSAGCSQPLAPTSPLSTSSESLSVASHTAPFKGTLEGTTTITPPNVFVAASGNATHLGQFTVEIPHVVNFMTGAGNGTYMFTAANGDRLTATFFGQADRSSPIFVLLERATITGGTGRFAGATGSFTAVRLLDPSTGATTGSFEGTISNGE